MLAAETIFVPSYDMLGLPMPAWLAQFLMALTLALHWAFLSLTAGGAAAHLLAGRRSSQGAQPWRRALAAFMPFSLTTAVTMGVAPLLFVQVLYGHFFYTANILMGYVWLGLLVVVIGIFYLLWYGLHRVLHGRSSGAVGLLVLALMALAAVILSANATLLQDPGVWQAFRAGRGVVPYLGDATFWPRWTFALFALVAGGGLFVSLLLRIWAALYRQAPPSQIASGLVAALLGLIGMLACGLWGSLALPAETRSALLTGAESIFLYAAILALVASAALAFLAKRSPSLAALAWPALTFFVGLMAVAALRDTIRRKALAAHFSLSTVAVHSQWSSFVLFAVIFVLGLALVAYMVRAALAPKGQAES